jgi:hypothetical protein
MDDGVLFSVLIVVARASQPVLGIFGQLTFQGKLISHVCCCSTTDGMAKASCLSAAFLA